jgi:hypothetical protein
MLEHLLGLVASELVERRLRRDALEPDPSELPQGVWRMRQSVFFRTFWAMMALLWAGAVALCVAAWALEGMDWRLLLPAIPFGAFAAFGFLSARDALVQEVELSHWGISEFRAGIVTTTTSWQGIRRVAFISYLDAYRVTTETGGSMQFSRHIRGLWRFKWFLLRYAPADALRSVQNRLGDKRRA